MATKVKLIADGVITPDQITLTTASTGTNTTAPATTAFVQQEISALVDSSPEALNTLNELAAALGDDANFSTTVTNSIATKAPLASPTFTGTLTASGLAYPTSDGTNGQALVTDGSGTLSFSTIQGYTDSDVETYLDGGTSTPTFSTATVTGDLTVSGTINIGGVTSTDSSFLSGTQRIVSDGYIATQAIYNYSETGESPAAIVFGNGSTYGLDQISLITDGVTALYIDSSQNISFGGKITSTVEAQAADDTFKSGTFFNVGENPINNPWHTCTQINSSGTGGGTANCGDCVDTTGTITGCSQGTGSAYNWYSAKRYCELAGMRLCTAAEVRAGAGNGTGCLHNERGQWTSTKGTTDSTKYFIVQGDGTGSSASAEQENYPYDTTITGFTNNEIGIRCCQQNSWS